MWLLLAQALGQWDLNVKTGYVELVEQPPQGALPLAELPAMVHELDPEQPIVCICHHGMRSLRAVHFLSHHGFAEVHDLAGGIDAWAVQQDPTMARY